MWLSLAPIQCQTTYGLCVEREIKGKIDPELQQKFSETFGILQTALRKGFATSQLNDRVKQLLEKIHQSLASWDELPLYYDQGDYPEDCMDIAVRKTMKLITILSPEEVSELKMAKPLYSLAPIQCQTTYGLCVEREIKEKIDPELQQKFSETFGILQTALRKGFATSELNDRMKQLLEKIHQSLESWDELPLYYDQNDYPEDYMDTAVRETMKLITILSPEEISALKFIGREGLQKSGDER